MFELKLSQNLQRQFTNLINDKNNNTHSKSRAGVYEIIFSGF